MEKFSRSCNYFKFDTPESGGTLTSFEVVDENVLRPSVENYCGSLRAGIVAFLCNKRDKM